MKNVRIRGGAIFTFNTNNTKIGRIATEATKLIKDRRHAWGPFVSVTTVSVIATCDARCRWYDKGCYAQKEYGRQTDLTLGAGSGPGAALQVMRDEVALIDERANPEGRALRLHEGGDVSCVEGAKLLAGAAQRWRERGEPRGSAVWTYTHKWRSIPREAWGPIHVFASIETPIDGPKAVALGYQPALVLEAPRSFPRGDKKFPEGGVKYVPCPEQSQPAAKRSCATCMLCTNLPPGTGIAFEQH